MALLTWGPTQAQCPQFTGNTVLAGVAETAATPHWFQCIDGVNDNPQPFTFELTALPAAHTGVLVDWGDGSSDIVGNWDGSALDHAYTPSEWDSYTITVTTSFCSGGVQGVLVHELANPSASLKYGDVNGGCAPFEGLPKVDIDRGFSPTWSFSIEWGDGSGSSAYDMGQIQAGAPFNIDPFTSADGETIHRISGFSHNYQAFNCGPGGCGHDLMLTYSNYCLQYSAVDPFDGTPNGPGELEDGLSDAFLTWNRDEAAINLSTTVLCWPESQVQVENIACANCCSSGQGNNTSSNGFVRRERWELGSATGAEAGGGGGDPSLWTDWLAACESQQIYDITFPGTGQFTLSLLTENICGVDTAEVEVRVINPPTVNITASAEPICPGTPFQFETVAWGFSAPGASSDFAFNFAWGDGASSPNIPMAGGMIPFEQLVGQSHAFINEGNFSASVTVFALEAPACTSTDVVPVPVLPAPTSGIVLPADSCTSAMSVQAEDASSDAMTWAWTLVNPPVDLGNDVVPAAVDLSETGTYWFELTTTSASGCSHTASESVSLNAFPVAAFTALPSCFGAATPLNPLTSTTNEDFGGPIVAYDWIFQGGSSAAEFPEPVFDAPGLYNVELTVTTASGCTDSTAVEVEVLDSPVVSLIGSDTTACAPLVLGLSALDTTGTLAMDDLIWDFGHGVQSSLDADGTHAFPHNFTDETVVYTVSVAAGLSGGVGGCGNSESITVEILPAPAIWLGDGQACSGDLFTFQAEAFGVAPGTEWTWVVENVYNQTLGVYGSAESQFPSWSYPFINPGNTTDTLVFSLELASPGGCVAQENATLYLQPALTVDLASVLDLAGSHCAPYTLEAAALPVLNASWDFGDAANADLPGATAHTYFSSDTFTVVFEGQSIFGCWGTDSLEVAVFDVPVIALNSSGAVCSPLQSMLTREELSSGSAGALGWNLAIDLGAPVPWNASSDTSLSLDAGLHLAVLTAVNAHGCTAEAASDLLVHPSVEAGFSLPSSGCAPVNIDIDALASGSGDAVSTWILDSQLGTDTTIGAAPGGPAWWTSGGGQDSSVWSVERTVVDLITGCEAFFSDSITVVQQPTGGLSVSGLSGCEVEAELAYSGSADSYFWTTGDPFEPGTVETPGPSLQHVYGNALGTGYWATATVVASTGGCVDEQELTFEVPAWVAAEMELPLEICSGEVVDLANLSVGIEEAVGIAAGAWTWTIDGVDMVAFEPLGVVLEAAGTANEVVDFELIAVHPETGCSDIATGQVVVLGTPAPAFLINPDVVVAPDFDADLVDLSVAAAGSTADWTVSSGGDVAGGVVSWSDDVWGEQSVTLILSNGGCTSAVTETVLLIPLPPLVQLAGDTTGCAPLQGVFSASVEGVVDSVVWDFGDGMTRVVNGSFGLDVLQGYFAPGEYVVTATAYGPGGYGISENVWVDVMLQVNAGFTVFPTVCLEAGESAEFTPYINYPSATYAWDFGDGAVDFTTGGMPVAHSFDAPGSPTVQLVVEQGVCSDSTWVTLCVEDLIGGSVSMPTAFTPLFGGGGSGSGGEIQGYDVRDNDIFAPVIRGSVLAYDFTVYNRWGEMIFHTSNPEIGWTGHYNGKICKQDVYVWKVAAVFIDGSSVEYAGDVTLIRR